MSPPPPPKPSICKNCSLLFPSKKCLRRHQVADHTFRCEYCIAVFVKRKHLQRHTNKKHCDATTDLTSRQPAHSQRLVHPPPGGANQPSMISCEACERMISKSGWSAHTSGAKHVKKAQALAFANTLKTTEGPRDGVELDKDEIDFGTLDTGSPRPTQVLRVKNTASVTVDFTARFSSTIAGHL